MEIIRVEITTDAAGDGIGFSRDKVKGKAVGIFVDIGDLAATTDITATGELSGTPLYSQTNAAADTAAAATANGFLFQERIKVVIAQGGVSKKGHVNFAIADG